jgi:hypothetical protein
MIPAAFEDEKFVATESEARRISERHRRPARIEKRYLLHREPTLGKHDPSRPLRRPKAEARWNDAHQHDRYDDCPGSQSQLASPPFADSLGAA